MAFIRNQIKLGRTSSNTSEDAFHILLNATRKPIYDRAHNTLSTIGQLRANLGLLDAPNWTNSHCSDYNTRPADARPESQAKPRQAANDLRNTISKESNIGTNIAYGVSVLAVLFLVTVLVIQDSSSTGSQQNAPNRATGAPPRGQSGIEYDTPRIVSQEASARKLREFTVARLNNSGIWHVDDNLINSAIKKISDNRTATLPATGPTELFFSSPGVAPLEIATAYGRNYYVKISEYATDDSVATVFIRGGEPFEMYLPTGSYQIKYVAGKDWFGQVLHFGPEGVYARCDDRFDFRRTPTGYSGYTIELILQARGNLDTDPIDPSEF